jgi:hypothetical protein
MGEATDAAADWNVIVTLPEATFREARKFLRRWGEVHRTGYFHVLALTVDDVESFLAEAAKGSKEKPGTLNTLISCRHANLSMSMASHSRHFRSSIRSVPPLSVTALLPTGEARSTHRTLSRSATQRRRCAGLISISAMARQ